MTSRRRAIVAALAVAVSVVAPSALVPAAAQAAAYRYWSYWLGTEAGWSFANVGPAFRVPADGTLEGWRFSVSGVQGNHAPSIAADFDAVCGETAAVEGRKRVAVVVDPGVAADAPEGEQAPGAWAMCVVAEPRATGYDVLRAAATVRAERGLICGIGGYPASGCADVIDDPAPSKSPQPTPSPQPTRTAEPTRTAKPSATPATPSADSPSPEGTTAVTVDAATTASPTSRARTSATPTPSPTSPSASPTPETPSSPTPEPTYSLLTTPLEEPPSDSGAGGAIVAGIAVVGIAGLGGAAILRMRRGA